MCTENGWTNKWPVVNGFYWLRGWRHYADLPIKIDGDEFWMMFNLAANHRMDLSDSEDVEFLGPFTAQDLEQLAAQRKAAVQLVIPYEALLADAESRKWIAPEVWTAIETGVAALREVLGVNRGQ